MAEEQATNGTATATAEPEKTLDELVIELQEKAASGDVTGIVKLAQQVAKAQRVKETAEQDAKAKELEAITTTIKASLDKFVEKAVADGKLDKADGVWYSYDFGDKLSTCRLMKAQAKRTTGGGGGGGGKKFDIGWKELLEKHGGEAYKETGMTCQQAWDSDVDKNKRFAVRSQMLKLEGLISTS